MSIDFLKAANNNIIKQQPTQAPAKPTDPENDPIFKQGYNKAVEECRLQAEGLVQNAIQESALKAGERLAAAINEKEQAVKDSLRQEWDHRETEWRTNFDAEVENKAAERGQPLRQQLSAAI